MDCLFAKKQKTIDEAKYRRFRATYLQRLEPSRNYSRRGVRKGQSSMQYEFETMAIASMPKTLLRQDSLFWTGVVYFRAKEARPRTNIHTPTLLCTSPAIPQPPETFDNLFAGRPAQTLHILNERMSPWPRYRTLLHDLVMTCHDRSCLVMTTSVMTLSATIHYQPTFSFSQWPVTTDCSRSTVAPNGPRVTPILQPPEKFQCKTGIFYM